MVRRHEQGFTLIELLMVLAIISIITALAIPGLTRAKRIANEASALGSLRVLSSAERVYADTCGKGGYAQTFAVLGAPPPGSSLGFISPDLVSALPIKGGYSFRLAPGTGSLPGPDDCNGTATVSTYYASAMPLSFGITGAWSYATNATHTIWRIAGAAAPTEPFGAPAAPIQ